MDDPKESTKKNEGESDKSLTEERDRIVNMVKDVENTITILQESMKTLVEEKNARLETLESRVKAQEAARDQETTQLLVNIKRLESENKELAHLNGQADDRFAMLEKRILDQEASLAQKSQNFEEQMRRLASENQGLLLAIKGLQQEHQPTGEKPAASAPTSPSRELTPIQPGSNDIAGWAERAMALFRDVIILCSDDARPAQRTHLERLLEEYGRLRVWMEQTGALQKGRGSLDEALSNDASLHSSFLEVLRRISNQTALALKMGSSSSPSAQADESDFTSDSEYSEDDQEKASSSLVVRDRPKVSRFSLLLNHIFEQVQLLYQFSTILRRPTLGGRYLHSKPQHAQPLVPSFEFLHIEQKLREWFRETIGHSSEHREGDDDLPERARALNMRIASANSRRRQQFLYWRQHPYDPPPEERAQSAEPDALMEDLPMADARSQAAPSEAVTNLTINTFSSVTRSHIFESGTGSGARTVYADSMVGNATSGTSVRRVPKVPIESMHSTSFKCPYCGMTLKSRQMQDRNTWKRHVFRDLRPYTCTAPRCSNPDKMYAARRDWVFHEFQTHLRQWKCRLCDHETFQQEQALAAHLNTQHGDHIKPTQLPAMLRISESKLKEHTIQQCAFCHDRHPVVTHLDHMAAHMEQLALFALPTADEDDEGLWETGDSSSSEDECFIPGQVQTYNCDQCPRNFTKEARLRRHQLITHEHERPKIRCDFPGCNEEFYRRDFLEAHRRLKHEIQVDTDMKGSAASSSEGANSLPIDSTDHSDYDSTLDRNNKEEDEDQDMDWKHPEEMVDEEDQIVPSPTSGRFKCNKCKGVTFSQKSALLKHMQNHDKRYACVAVGCNKTYSTQRALERHTNDKHLRHRRYHCTETGCIYAQGGTKTFPRKESWRRHMEKIHNITVSTDMDPILASPPALLPDPDDGSLLSLP